MAGGRTLEAWGPWSGEVHQCLGECPLVDSDRGDTVRHLNGLTRDLWLVG